MTKTWEVLDRETGIVKGGLISAGRKAARSYLLRSEVAHCRETGEVVYR